MKLSLAFDPSPSSLSSLFYRVSVGNYPPGLILSFNPQVVSKFFSHIIFDHNTFNPTATAAFYAAGLGADSDSLFSASLRFPAQGAGAAAGALAISEVMPIQYRHMLGGPSLKVDIHTGAIAEGVLTFVISFVVLVIVFRGPSNILVKNWLLAMLTVGLVVAGSGYTGPSMNPANAFGWAYMNNMHNTWEQLYVYWICPFVGAILAAWVFRFLFPPPTMQKKKA